MAIDRDKALALELPEYNVDVERGQLRFFAQATNARDAVYSDVVSAQKAGYPDLPVPPTFFFSLEMAGPDPFGYIAPLGIDLRHVLHGEQQFDYHAMAFAGETLHFKPRIEDVFSKKGGALEFLVKRTDITRDDRLVCESTTVIVVRNPTGAAQ